jgi:hypothetical protein
VDFWWISEFEASLVYKVSSRTARAIKRNPVSKNQKKKKKKKTNKQLFFDTAFPVVLLKSRLLTFPYFAQLETRQVKYSAAI